jgi:hypothetical protein
LRQVSQRSTEALEVVSGRRALDAAVKDDILAVRAAAVRSGLPDTPLARTLELLGKLVDRLCIDSATRHKEAAAEAAESEAPTSSAEAMRGARLVHALLRQMVPLAEGRATEAAALAAVAAAAAAPAGRKALLVGVNYEGATHAEVKLTGAVKDAHTMQALLVSRLGFQAGDVRLLTDEAGCATPPTSQHLRKALRWLTAGAAPGDHLFFFFAGLATLVPDVDGDGAGGRDQCVCPLDMLTASPDLRLSDEELRATLFFGVPEGVRVTAVFDCAHGGTVADLAAVRLVEPQGGFPAASKPASTLKPVAKPSPAAAAADASTSAAPKARFWYRAGVEALKEPAVEEEPAAAAAAATSSAARAAAVAAVCSGGVVVITACGDAQMAYEVDGQGAATAALAAALTSGDFAGGPAPAVTALVEAMNARLAEQGLEQTVQLRVVGKALEGADCRFLQ